ncbi:uncharacterized protein LOC115740066 isoform X2 [Rhodamnia argentea]|uniref:Uncharacterized protein LOC115740066 isoform X2 n=1 Tax=Rhodamnia argentea TaxID=178133 RepID=A0A8B8P3E4_9MYRT|nr:uncharacterized protein LOC115740066 isoform X2 [Rhodamnia argentea]
MARELAEEEFEPLFDYSSVQPKFPCLDDDDSDEEPIFIPKRQKDGKGENDGIPQVILCDSKKEEKEKEEEDDWLPPPPKFDANVKSKLAEDPALKELRLMKQELQAFAQSANLLQSVEDSAQKKVSSPSQSLKDASTELPKPQHERAKIVISIQDKDGPKQFRVFLDDKFERLFKLYADRVKLNQENLVFTFDGEKISPSATPCSLGMEDEDILEVHVKSS